MGTHPIFESDFDCLTDLTDPLPNMAVGKNKRLTKGRKGNKKKIVDPFTKKEWYKVKAPAVFKNRPVGQTLVTRSAGTKLAADGLRGRVYEVNQADLHGDESTYKKFRLICEEVQGDNCLTNFHGMELTRDKQCSMIKKWQTKIEAHVDVTSTDGTKLRLFAVGFTKKRQNQVKKTTYAQSNQVRTIRKKMMTIMRREVSTSDIKNIVAKLLPDSIGQEILKKPRFDMSKLLDMHGESGKVVKGGANDGAVVDSYEPPVLDSVYENKYEH